MENLYKTTHVVVFLENLEHGNENVYVKNGFRYLKTFYQHLSKQIGHVATKTNFAQVLGCTWYCTIASLATSSQITSVIAAVISRILA